MTDAEADRTTYGAAHVTTWLGIDEMWVAAAGRSGYTVMCKVVSAGQYVERSSKWPQRAFWAACHLKFERARRNFGAWLFPRHSDRASVSFACLPEVLDELRMSFRILDVEVGAQRSQPCGKHLRGI
jgi:hypothetical protein